MPYSCGCQTPNPVVSSLGGLYCHHCGGDIRLVEKAAQDDQTARLVPNHDVAVAEVRKLAERVTVLEGMVGELRRTVAELLRAPAMAAPAEQKKGYWR